MNMNDESVLRFYEYFTFYFIREFPKQAKKYFLNSKFDEKGGYIYLKNNKEYSITKNTKRLKKLLNVRYSKNTNVLGNLIKIIFSHQVSYLRTIFNIRICSKIIHNCYLNEDHNNLIELNSSTIEKIIELYDDFKIVKKIQDIPVSNNPIILLNEIMTNKINFKLVLNKILKKISYLKDEITKQKEIMDNKIQVVKNEHEKVAEINYIYKLKKENQNFNIMNKFKQSIIRRDKYLQERISKTRRHYKGTNTTTDDLRILDK